MWNFHHRERENFPAKVVLRAIKVQLVFAVLHLASLDLAILTSSVAMSAPHEDPIDGEQPDAAEEYINPEDYEEVDVDDEDHMDEDEEEGEDGMEGMEEGGVIEDNSLGHSEHHTSTQSVFSLGLHPSFPNPPLAISGGEDDLAYIFCPIPDTFHPATSTASSAAFNSTSFSPIKLTGHADSVVATEFSGDGELVATGGMDGKVRVWRRVKGRGEGNDVAAWSTWEFLTTLTTDDEVTWIAWHPKGPVLAAGCNDSTIWMWQRESPGLHAARDEASLLTSAAHSSQGQHHASLFLTH